MSATPSKHMPLNLTLHTLSELDEARSAGAAACILAIMVYVLGCVVVCRRRCCNAQLGFGKCCCSSSSSWDGRMCSRRWGRIVCALFLCIVLALAISTIVFFAKFPWTVQNQQEINACATAVTSTDPFEPCGLSYKVFYGTVSAYAWLGIVLLLSWGSCCWMGPGAACCTKTYGAYTCDDGFEIDGLFDSSHDNGNYTWMRTPEGEYVVVERKGKKEKVKPMKSTQGIDYTPIRVTTPRRLTWSDNVEYFANHNTEDRHHHHDMR